VLEYVEFMEIFTAVRDSRNKKRLPSANSLFQYNQISVRVETPEFLPTETLMRQWIQDIYTLFLKRIVNPFNIGNGKTQDNSAPPGKRSKTTLKKWVCPYNCTFLGKNQFAVFLSDDQHVR